MSIITFEEKFDAVKLKYLVKNFNKYFHDYNDKYKKDLLSKLQKLAKSKGKITTVYVLKSGRYFAEDVSLHNVNKRIRHTIGYKYHDIDVVNCGATLVSQWCRQHKIPCPHLFHYVERRDELLKTLNMSRADAKQTIIRLMNGGSVCLDGMPEWVTALYEEMQHIRQEVYDRHPDLHCEDIHDCNPELQDEKMYNPLGKTFSYFYYYVLENKVLMAMLDKLQKMKRVTNCCVLVHDGIMIPIKAGDTDDILKNLLLKIQEHVFEKTSYNIRLEIKPMNEGITIDTDQTTEIVNYPIYTPVKYPTVITDSHAHGRIVLFKRHGKDIVVTEEEGRICVRTKWGKWTDNKRLVDDIILEWALDSNLCKQNAEGERQTITTRKGVAMDIAGCLKSYIRAHHVESEFYKKIFSTTQFKILFKNKYYDFERGEFLEGFDGIYSFVQIDRPAPEIRNEKDIQELKEVILYPILGVFMDQWLLFIALAIAGHVDLKLWGIHEGPRDRGKSKLGELLSNVLQGYFTSFSSDFIMKRQSGGDPHRDNAVAFKLQHSRVVFLSEAENTQHDNKPKYISGKTIKSWFGDEPQIEARKLREESVIFKSQATGIIACNNIPESDDAGVLEKLIPFGTPHEFSDDPSKIDYKTVFPRNERISRLLREPRILDAFFWLIIDTYKKRTPYKLIPEQERLLQNHQADNPFELFYSQFMVTGNKEDFIYESQVTAFKENNQLLNDFTPKKIAIDNQNKGVYRSRHPKDKKKILKGMKEIPSEDEDEETKICF